MNFPDNQVRKRTGINHRPQPTKYNQEEPLLQGTKTEGHGVIKLKPWNMKARGRHAFPPESSPPPSPRAESCSRFRGGRCKKQFPTILHDNRALHPSHLPRYLPKMPGLPPVSWSAADVCFFNDSLLPDFSHPSTHPDHANRDHTPAFRDAITAPRRDVTTLGLSIDQHIPLPDESHPDQPCHPSLERRGPGCPRLRTERYSDHYTLLPSSG